MELIVRERMLVVALPREFELIFHGFCSLVGRHSIICPFWSLGRRRAHYAKNRPIPKQEGDQGDNALLECARPKVPSQEIDHCVKATTFVA
jgi:hypothetical protein